MKRTTLTMINEVSEKLAEGYLKSAKVSIVLAAAATAVFAASTFVLTKDDEYDEDEEEYEE